MAKPLIGITLTWIALCSAIAARAESSSGNDPAVSGGITFPSATSAPFQNPGGLVFTRGTTLDANVEFTDDRSTHPLTTGGVYYGDGEFGVSAGLKSDKTTAYAGLAVYSPELRLSLGLAGFRSFTQGGESTFNLGTLLEPIRGLHIGVTGIDFMNATREWGMGLGYDLVSSVSLVVDSSFDHSFKDAWLQPGIATRASRATLTIGYGFPALNKEQAASRVINDGIYLGGSLQLTQNLATELRYREYSNTSMYALEMKYFLGGAVTSSRSSRPTR